MTDDDLETLWRWRNSEDFRNLCSWRKEETTFEEFKNELSRDFSFDRHSQYLIRRKTNGEALGTIFSYNLNTIDGFVFITVFIADKFRQLGYGVEAFLLLATHLFLEYDLHKIYTEVYEHNGQSLRPMIKWGFCEEGRFREHRRYQEGRCDLIRLAVYRDQLSRAVTLLEKMGAV